MWYCLKREKRLEGHNFENLVSFCPFWLFFSFWCQFIMYKRSLFILDNCMPSKEHNYRCYPVCYICNNNILLHLPDIWYLVHHRWNLCPTVNKRQLYPLLSCHYPMSLLCPNMCLAWMGQTLNMLLLLKCCSFSQKCGKKVTELLFSFPAVYFLPFFSGWVHKRYVKIT